MRLITGRIGKEVDGDRKIMRGIEQLRISILPFAQRPFYVGLLLCLEQLAQKQRQNSSTATTYLYSLPQLADRR
jgi:hypothetical protein